MTCGRVLENCVFCDAPETTEEHIVADWAPCAFMKSKRQKAGFNGEFTDGNTLRMGVGEAIDTAKVVCQPCNNGWLSDVDEAAANALKPAIRGQASVTLDADGQSAVAAWVFKCALIFDVQGHGATGPLSSLRPAFARDRLAPPGTVIYVGPAPPVPFKVEGFPEVAGLALFGVRPTPGVVNVKLNVKQPDGTTVPAAPIKVPSPGWTVMLGRINAIISGQRGPIIPTPEWGFHRVWPTSSAAVTISSAPPHTAP
jgi:hypothetical protein